MRLIASLTILLVTVLDFRFGQPRAALQIAGLVAGVLLALSVAVDRLLTLRNDPPAPATTERDEHPSEPGE